ncbi:class I SAM-dependent methyltransferase [Streptomyces sp. ACA25]|uniref:class I SAM-dependent methyltransferase n=1 Tax=Streptomyces sp. ACA25 TaxID=3022596 RepID=UPI00230747D3|nr:class I SAM-dependent methyltransferase [Streptomyces sp. ACA25]MDB1089739.1 class I SAM-dependent methyltransferase [Streptomyces sp. ACA25]
MAVQDTIRTSSMEAIETAADLAAVGALLQIAAELEVDHVLDAGEPFSVAELAGAAGAPEAGIGDFLDALLAAGLVLRAESPEMFQTAGDFEERRYQAGYLSWAFHANAPFIEHATAFLRDPDGAARIHSRNGRRVAVSSRWIGNRAFYPAAFRLIAESGAKRVVDLGSGAAGLLIELLRESSERTGVALDISPAASDQARQAADKAGVGDRMEVVTRSIESVAEDRSPIEGAEVIHAGFVLHDVVNNPTARTGVLRGCREALAPGGFLAVTDAVPYATDERERRFSALFTYLHATFMKVDLPTEREWREAFLSAGFSQVSCLPHRFPGGRLFIVSN